MTYITGIGRTKFGVLEDSLESLIIQAATDCLRDANKTIKDVDAIYVSNFSAARNPGQMHLTSIISSLFHFNGPVYLLESACASGGFALNTAVKSGFNNILVLGVEILNGPSQQEITQTIGLAGHRVLDYSNGVVFPAAYSLIASNYFHKYGNSLEALSLISLKNHENANKNPYSHFYDKKVSLEMINSSQVVSSPLRLFDCSPVSDGAVALFLSKNKQKETDIEIAASSIATDYISLVERPTLTSFSASKRTVSLALQQAKLKIENISFFEVHDCFTIAELIAMEDIGICKPGEAPKLVTEGKTKINGDFPINPDGGLKADGHAIGATGLAQVYESCLQLRGKAEQRQVKDAEIALTHNVGGVGGSVAIHILRK